MGIHRPLAAVVLYFRRLLKNAKTGEEEAVYWGLSWPRRTGTRDKKDTTH
jgi:hypothetical protein